MPTFDLGKVVGPVGPQGEPFKYEDFTTEQLAALRGPQGLIGPTGPQGIPGVQGERGEPFEYEDFTTAQLDALAQLTASVVLEAANICYVTSVIPTADVGKDGDICVVVG